MFHQCCTSGVWLPGASSAAKTSGNIKFVDVENLLWDRFDIKIKMIHMDVVIDMIHKITPFDGPTYSSIFSFRLFPLFIKSADGIIELVYRFLFECISDAMLGTYQLTRHCCAGVA